MREVGAGGRRERGGVGVLGVVDLGRGGQRLGAQVGAELAICFITVLCLIHCALVHNNGIVFLMHMLFK